MKNVEDILNILSQTDRMETTPSEPYQIHSLTVIEISEKERTEIHKKLLKRIAHDPIAVDELCRWCHVSADIVQSFLLELELAGQIQRHSGSRVSRLIPRD